MKRKFPCIILLGLLTTLACNALGPASATSVPVPTVNISVEVPTATAIPIPTIVSSFEIPNAAIEYYEVSGATEGELRDHLNALSPVDENGYRGDALTSWEIHWNWDGYGTDTCDLSSVATSYEIKVLLPRWTPPQDASSELISKWNAYMFALVEHEKGHVDLAMDYLPQVIDSIRKATCETAEMRAQDVLSQLRSEDRRYDQETGHGATQGAVFP